MLPKQIAYILIGVIALLSAVFGFSIYSNLKKNQDSEKKISAIISQFEEKFKNDSTYLANANKLLIDKISQHIIDSVSTVYEKKLKSALLESNKYKQLLIANNIKIETTISPKINSETDNFKNITTYSKLNKALKTPKADSEQLDITTISKIENKKTYANVTTYSKINRQHDKPKKSTFNITTYSKIDKSEKITNSSKLSVKNKRVTSNKNLTHNNYELDHAENINDLDAVPVYKGCENFQTEEKRKNCFAVNISKHIMNKFNSLNINHSNLKKGLHKVRVLFVVNEHGKAKIGKLVGKWPHQIYSNAKTAIESTPSMTPGYSNNKAISVKYSLLIPFVIK